LSDTVLRGAGSRLDAFRHEAFLYAGATAFLEGTVPFVEAGLEAGEPVLVVVDAEKIERMREALGGDADRVAFADMAEVGSNPARIIPAWRDFLAANGGGLGARGIGEPVDAGRTPDELVECQRHEALLNVAFAMGTPWRLLCPYDTTALPPAVLREARPRTRTTGATPGRAPIPTSSCPTRPVSRFSSPSPAAPLNRCAGSCSARCATPSALRSCPT
jgi:hypothetical protein